MKFNSKASEPTGSTRWIESLRAEELEIEFYILA
jgi:hypothetical protein